MLNLIEPSDAYPNVQMSGGCPPTTSLFQMSVNISDTGEMGASTPAVTVILGHKAFHLVPTGSREMLSGNIRMLYTQRSVPSPRAEEVHKNVIKKIALVLYCCFKLDNIQERCSRRRSTSSDTFWCVFFNLFCDSGSPLESNLSLLNKWVTNT